MMNARLFPVRKLFPLGLLLCLLALLSLAPTAPAQAQSFGITITEVTHNSFVVGYVNPPAGWDNIIFGIPGLDRYIITQGTGPQSWKVTGLVTGATYIVRAGAHDQIYRVNPLNNRERALRVEQLAYADTTVTLLSAPPPPPQLAVTAAYDNGDILINLSNLPAWNVLTGEGQAYYLDIEFNASRSYHRVYALPPRVSVISGGAAKRVPGNGSKRVSAKKLWGGFNYTVTVTARTGNMPNSALLDPTGTAIANGSATSARFLMPIGAGTGPLPWITTDSTVGHNHSIEITFRAVTGADYYRISQPFPTVQTGMTRARCRHPKRLANRGSNDSSDDIAKYHSANNLTTVTAAGTYYCGLNNNTVYNFIFIAMKDGNEIARGTTSWRTSAGRTRPAQSSGGADGEATQRAFGTQGVEKSILRSRTQAAIIKSESDSQDSPPEPTATPPPPILPSLNMNISEVTFSSVTVTWDDVSPESYLLVFLGGGTGASIHLTAD